MNIRVLVEDAIRELGFSVESSEGNMIVFERLHNRLLMLHDRETGVVKVECFDNEEDFESRISCVTFIVSQEGTAFELFAGSVSWDSLYVVNFLNRLFELHTVTKLLDEARPVEATKQKQ